MQKFLTALLLLLLAMSCKQASETTPATAPAEPAAPPPAEFADLKYTEIGKNALKSLTSGDMTAWNSIYADNAVYVWNNGDSLVGKQAIADFWNKRRTEMIDSISFKNEIWLPIKVNQPQSVEAQGVWLLGWYEVHARYKNGKSMTQWMHIDYHFDANDKVDRVINYRDNALILAATKK